MNGLIGRTSRQTWSVLLLAFTLSLSGETCFAKGYVKFGVWPRHNEDILNVHGDINKFRVELSQRFRFQKLELEVNPVFKFGGNWPKYTTEYGYDWINAEYNVIFRFFATDKMHFFYHKKWYRDVFAKDDASWCNCTYANEIGIQYDW